jgi:type II secretion system protein G
MKQFKLGFTLIELLVVIAIIGSLSAIFLPNYMAVRERARDTQRKSDLKTIQKAFELYKQDHLPESYPSFSGNLLPSDGSCFSSGSNCSGNVYTSHFPKDPLASFHYTYTPGAGLTYTLCACLENKADPDATSGNCSGLTCSSSNPKSYIVTQP